MTMTTLEAVHVTDPQALERARRLQHAVSLLRDGLTKREASGAIWQRWSCSRSTAWRLVDMASDLVLKEPAK